LFSYFRLFRDLSSQITMETPEGILIIDKPQGFTSHDVVARVRKIIKTRRAGHTGTLDPFATGVLVICLNRATRIARFLSGDDKEYLATMRLGFATETGDLTGKPLSSPADARHITGSAVNEAFAHFRGLIRQVTPMYSARKVGGVKLYELARRGEEVIREPVEIEIKELELCQTTDFNPSEANSIIRDFSFRVVCSAGTYVRTLAEDIGAHLGVGAHLRELRRVRAGSCHLDRAISLERLGELTVAGQIEQALIPMGEIIALDEVHLNEAELDAIAHGRSISRSGDWLNGCYAKLYDSNRNLVAVAEFDATRQLWRPRVVLATF
jgi:tRNA pseudouridine55 synthase